MPLEKGDSGKEIRRKEMRLENKCRKNASPKWQQVSEENERL